MRAWTSAYGWAVLVGIAAALFLLPPAALEGVGPGWDRGIADQMQAATGHLAFQADRWRWPPLFTTALFWPHGVSIALADSNPLVSLLAKLWVTASGAAPANWLGAFLGLCLVLQAVCAVYAARGFGAGPEGAAAAPVLAVAWPALLARMVHPNLFAHFWLLLALGLVARRTGPPGSVWRTWRAPLAVLLGSILTQPYLFQLCAALFAAIPLGRLLARARQWRIDALAWVGSACLAAGLLRLISGPLGGGDHGFVIFSMNLLSPFWPQRSGLFGPDLPIVQGVEGQYEGFNYLGGGMLLLVAVAAFRVRPVPRAWRGLLVVLAGLALLSLSSRVYAGSSLLLDLGTKPWEDIFGTFRTPGRAFWPVGYAIMLAAVAGVERWPRRVAGPALAACCLLQAIDARPLAAEDRRGWADGVLPAPLPIPDGATLVSVSPYPNCGVEPEIRPLGTQTLLAAARAGARLGEIGLGRPQNWFSCQQFAADEAELPLMAGEFRAYYGRTEQGRVVPTRIGATCTREGDAVLCGNGLALAGAKLPAGDPRPVLPVPFQAEGRALGPLLGSLWSMPEGGPAWSEGAFATLVFAVPPGRALEMRLKLIGVAERQGGTRHVTITLGRAETALRLDLPDGEETEATLAIPATASGLVRLALRADRAVDPAKRGLQSPVRRAALILTGAALSY